MSEDAFLRQLFSRLPAAPAELRIPPGDDCAALDLGNGRLLLLTVDQVIAGTHYHAAGPNAAPPELVGRKLMARNLSDIAAMGGVPRYALAACALGHEQDQDWLARLCAGIVATAADFGVHLIGGDIARLPADTAGGVFSLTLTGEVEAGLVCRRSGARPGDLLFATGAFGNSLETGHHLNFSPRCAEGRWLAQNSFANAMIDVSDGLVKDAGRLAAAAGIGLDLDAAAFPLRTPQTTPLQAAGDGEDYELLFAVSPPAAPRLRASWPFAEVPLNAVGAFTAARTPMVRVAGLPEKAASLGYDHLSAN